LPRLTVKQVLTWADAFHDQTGEWPTYQGSAQHIPGALGERWHNLDRALRQGRRGFPGGSSLAQLLAEHRGVRNHMCLSRLTIKQILAWADAFHEQTGEWPSKTPSPQTIEGTLDERWASLDSALRKGQRGLPGGSSLARLLAKHRGVRNPSRLPRLTLSKILAWADAYHVKTGEWPKCSPQIIEGMPGEKWSSVDHALYTGTRGLPGGSSLARLLAKYRGVPIKKNGA
jgi:hypothetical protein